MFRFIMAVCLISISCPSFSSIEINGTYEQYIEDGVYSTLVVERKDQSGVFISMNCQNGAPNFNSGMVKRTLLKLNNNTVRYNKARFDDGACIIDIEFTENQANVSQIAGYGAVCGFGMKVICDGVFTKK